VLAAHARHSMACGFRAVHYSLWSRMYLPLRPASATPRWSHRTAARASRRSAAKETTAVKAASKQRSSDDLPLLLRRLLLLLLREGLLAAEVASKVTEVSPFDADEGGKRRNSTAFEDVGCTLLEQPFKAALTEFSSLVMTISLERRAESD